MLRVVGKGGKAREVPVAPELLERLRKVRGWAFPIRQSGTSRAGHVSKLVSRGPARTPGPATRSATGWAPGPTPGRVICSRSSRSWATPGRRPPGATSGCPDEALREAIAHVELMQGRMLHAVPDEPADTIACPSFCEWHEDVEPGTWRHVRHAARRRRAADRTDPVRPLRVTAAATGCTLRSLRLGRGSTCRRLRSCYVRSSGWSPALPSSSTV